ncbi:MAG TPA: glycosyltransferase family 4 protein, partial [Fibrobacteraceae bacterium]|nr:glycosyltransferase family 4 protein [Fibrobacteraceae bacterium]
MAYDVVLTANYSPWSRYHGGLQKSVDQLALAMSHLGVRVGVVYSRTPWERIQIPDRPYGLHWVFFHAIRPGISSPGRIFNSFPFVRLLQKITGPATVIQGNGDEAWNFPRFFPGRFVYTHRQPFFPDYLQGDWTSRSHRIRILFRENREWAYARAVLGANQVTCTSQFNAEKLQSLFRLTRIPQVVPNGIAPEFLVAPLEARGHHILYFGRLSRGKGVVELCEAWNSLPSVLRRQHPLHLVGHGELIKTIQMKFRGFAPDLRPVLRGALEGKTLATEVATAALIVLPSQSESFGNTMLEA